MNKAKFVRDYMEPMLTHCHADIVSATYVKNDRMYEENGILHFDEEIVIEYAGGGRRIVNVSMDSYSAMIKDIVRQGVLD